MKNEDLKQHLEKLLTDEMGETCSLTVTVASKLKVELGEDFYIFDDNDEVGYVKFRGWYPEVSNTIRRIRKILRANKSHFTKLI